MNGPVTAGTSGSLEGIPLKKSPSLTQLVPEDDDAVVFGDAGMESFNMLKDASLAGITKTFETLYQSDESAFDRPESAPSPNPQYGKLLDPILEIKEAERTLMRLSEEGFDIMMTYKDIEGVSDFSETSDYEIYEPKKDWIYTLEEAEDVAEEIIKDLEQDLTEVLKFRGMLPDAKDKTDNDKQFCI